MKYNVSFIMVHWCVKALTGCTFWTLSAYVHLWKICYGQ